MLSIFKKKYQPAPDRPSLIEIEPTYSCNLRCIMCHVPTHSNKKPQFLDIRKLEEATKGFNDCHINLGSEYEPTIHPNFPDLLKLIVKRNWKVDFLSNATKFHLYDEKILRDIKFNIYQASFDGYSKESFEYTRKDADFELVKSNILKMAEIVKSNGSYTAINSTVVKSNLSESVDMIREWNKHGFDLVRLCIAQARSTDEEVLKEILLPYKDELFKTFKDIANDLVKNQMRIGVKNGYYGSKNFQKPENIFLHGATIFSKDTNYKILPEPRQDILDGPWPGMSVDCKSAFLYCRIRWDGYVDLCNRRDWVIGNIYENSLSEIWNGAKANKIRENIIKDVEGCKTCDYFNFCIKNREQDYNDDRSFFAAGVAQVPGIYDKVRNL